MRDQTRPDTLSIVIPALNEEEAIAGTIRRCLEARARIRRAAGLRDVEIIVVSDGSTDRTAEIAQTFSEIKVIVFEKNRGYGAAIKEGFAQSSGTLVGFLDADGTCDPTYFAEMCRIAAKEGAEVVLGSRMGKTSKMPPIRRFGNNIFAALLGLLCGRQVTDTASGMRVIRRSALAKLYPLPDRMHFTPAMSARALMNNLHIVEIPMHYEERIGRSKLNVIKDGFRFLHAIFAAVLCYRPERLFLMGFVLCLTLGTVIAAYPVEFYLRHQCLEEWMIYRFMACFLLGACGQFLLSSTALAHQMATFGPRRNEGGSYWPSIISALFEGKILAVCIGLMLTVAGIFLGAGIVEYVTTGHTTLHWSRLFVGAFGLLMAFHVAVTWILLQVVALWKYEREESGRRQSETLLFDGADDHIETEVSQVA
jgi:glycosyltransferase involved in cell wall biosynthesis